MKKLNKKGFTLVEMLVVIAIIAVLVAIIIPIVTTATVKAAAATNAANLRSVQAEATIQYLAPDGVSSGNVTYTAGTDGAKGTFTVSGPNSKACGTIYAGGEAPNAEFDTDGKTVIAYYGSEKTHDITYFSTIAETGSEPTA